MGKRGCFHLLRCDVRLREVLRTFAAQRFNSVLFHLQMEQEPVGTGSIAEGLQGGDVGASQRHTIVRQVEHLAMPLEDVERVWEDSEDRVLLSLGGEPDRSHADFQRLAGSDSRTQRFRHELTAETDSEHWLAGQERGSNKRCLFRNPGIGIVHRHWSTHDNQEVAGVRRQTILRHKMAIEGTAMLGQRGRKDAKAFKGNVLEAHSSHGHPRVIESPVSRDASERYLIQVPSSSGDSSEEEKEFSEPDLFSLVAKKLSNAGIDASALWTYTKGVKNDVGSQEI